MPYAVISIGREFSTRGLQALQERLNQLEGEGWEFVFAFPVTHTSCLFIRQETYLAVLRTRPSTQSGATAG